MSFCKNGTIVTNGYTEKNAILLGCNSVASASDILNNTFDYQSYTYTYTPTVNVSNYCYQGLYVSVLHTKYSKVRVRVTISWDEQWTYDTAYSSAGTWWQGTTSQNGKLYEWAGTNAVCSALNSHKSLTTLLTSADSGTYTYDIIVDLSSALEDGKGTRIFNVGMRTDYKTNGSLTITDFIVTPIDTNTRVEQPVDYYEDVKEFQECLNNITNTSVTINGIISIWDKNNLCYSIKWDGTTTRTESVQNYWLYGNWGGNSGSSMLTPIMTLTAGTYKLYGCLLFYQDDTDNDGLSNSTSGSFAPSEMTNTSIGRNGTSETVFKLETSRTICGIRSISIATSFSQTTGSTKIVPYLRKLVSSGKYIGASEIIEY